ncbi:ABC transporter permease [Motilibacter aurantiacus]|uniref:ABC transporter permease n=1 Tax=Motilibacter aurantiacus TaxID=2714955 RepID=UPI002F2B331B
MREQLTPRNEDLGAAAGAPVADEHARVERAAAESTAPKSAFARLADSSAGRNSGLVLALVVICAIGLITKGDTFATTNNVWTILRLAAVGGVISVGMTFVIIAGGIDLSVGAIVALASVWATTTGTQDIGTFGIIFTSIVVATACGVINGVLIAYGKVVAFIATLAGLATYRGLAENLSDRKTQSIDTPSGFLDFFGAEPGGIPVLVIMFAVVAVLGWLLLNRTTFGRRTFAIGGNPEAARLAGINVKRQTVMLYALLGFLCGIATIMILARTSAGTSTHGNLYELDAIAAVVIGGTLLSGGRGTIVGTVFGVLIFQTLNNIFTLNNLTTSTQAVAKGLIIVAAVLLQQRVAKTSRS